VLQAYQNVVHSRHQTQCVVILPVSLEAFLLRDLIFEDVNLFMIEDLGHNDFWIKTVLQAVYLVLVKCLVFLLLNR